MWNHTFVYDDVTLQELADRSLELTVWDHDRLASNEFLGMVRFSLGTGTIIHFLSCTEGLKQFFYRKTSRKIGRMDGLNR